MALPAWEDCSSPLVGQAALAGDPIAMLPAVFYLVSSGCAAAVRGPEAARYVG